MIVFKPYSNIKDFLQRYTLLKIGKLHIRLHKIIDKDNTNFFHNHPFDYISIILKGGYTEICLDENGNQAIYKHGLLSIIRRNHGVQHRIDEVKPQTITLFIAFGKYKWHAINKNAVHNNNSDGLFQREINNKIIWCKKENDIWFIGNEDKKIAESETRHSIHQCLNPITTIH